MKEMKKTGKAVPSNLKLPFAKTHCPADNIEQDWAVGAKEVKLLPHVETQQVLFGDRSWQFLFELACTS